MRSAMRSLRSWFRRSSWNGGSKALRRAASVPGQLEALTGIVERRWWEEGYRISDGAIAAARRALEASSVRPTSSKS